MPRGRYTESQDGVMRITLRAEIRVDRKEHEELAALASHLGISTRELLDRCLRNGLQEEKDIASGGTPRKESNA